MLPVMRLIGWCKNIDRDCERQFRSIFRPSVLDALVQKKYLRPYSEVYGWRLTPAGYTWLEEQGFPMQADQHTQRVNRRFENAKVILSMYAAGIDPFTHAVSELRKKDGYLPAAVLRAKAGQHPLGSNLVSGFLRRGDTMLAVHYPQTAQRVIVQREIDCAQSVMLGSGGTKQAYLLCGRSYTDIYRALLDEQLYLVVDCGIAVVAELHAAGAELCRTASAERRYSECGEEYRNNFLHGDRLCADAHGLLP